MSPITQMSSRMPNAIQACRGKAPKDGTSRLIFSNIKTLMTPDEPYSSAASTCRIHNGRFIVLTVGLFPHAGTVSPTSSTSRGSAPAVARVSVGRTVFERCELRVDPAKLWHTGKRGRRGAPDARILVEMGFTFGLAAPIGARADAGAADERCLRLQRRPELQGLLV